MLIARRGGAMALPGACSGGAAVLLGLAFQNIVMMAIGALLTGASVAMLRYRMQDRNGAA